MTAAQAVADPEKFWWGGDFEAQNLKNSDVFTKIESDFSAEFGNSNVFFAQIQVVSKKKRSSPKLRLIFRPNSEIQNVFFAKIETDFFAGLVTFRSVGGDASRNGAELFENRG